MEISIKKDPAYAESTVTIIGLTKTYGRPQYILVEADNQKLKFPGLRFRAPYHEPETLEDVARVRFEEQTGLTVDKMLGLRTIVPTRSRHSNQWQFRNVFYVVVNNTEMRKEQDIARKVYVADPGQGFKSGKDEVAELGNFRNKRTLEWVIADNQSIARSATNVLNHFNWDDLTCNWDRRIPCLGAQGLTESEERPLGYALGVASMMVIYKPSVDDPWNVIMVQRKGDEFPGYAGGKIETPESRKNTDPISCCIQEGVEEFGFGIQPRALIAVSVTPLGVPKSKTDLYYNSIINYAFIAEPTNPLEVKEALANPSNHLEGKMDGYVIETLEEHRDRINAKQLRTPDMIQIGNQFYQTSPGNKINLSQIRASGEI